MKTIAEPTFVQTSNVGETKRATIKASAKIFNFFSEQIYSDKFTAIWRELVANGIDGQKVNGCKSRPIVTVPSILEPYAKVRDFGCSMDHEFMMDKFMAFTDASTKETSNEFIGGFGIGSKAPLSYTDQYSIRCFKDGVVRVYSVFKDEEGCPSIAFLSEAPTTEPDGVEVGFPVRQDDIVKFTDTVVRTLQYFDPLPVLENTALELTPVQYDARGAKWGIRIASAARQAKLVIGGVSYPLDVSKIPYSYANLRSFSGLGLDIYLDIGEANIALSREHVTHDEDLFKKLDAITKGIGEEFGKQVSQKFDTAATPWEARRILSDAIKDSDYSTANLLRKYAVYKGQKIEMQIGRPKDFEVLVIAYGDFDYSNAPSGIPVTQAISPKFRAWTDYGGFTPSTFNRIIIDDVDSSDKPALRIRAAIEKHGDRILFLRWNDPTKPADWPGYLKALGQPPKDFISYLSAYQPVTVTRAASTGSGSRSFKCYIRESTPYRGGEAHSALPSGGGLYVVMDNFSPNSTGKNIGIARLIQPKNIVWLNKTDFIASGIDKMPEWVSVDQAVDKVKTDYKKKHKNLARAEAVYRWHSHGSEALSDQLEKLAKLSNFPKRGPLPKLLALLREFKAVATSDHSEIRVTLLGVDYADEYAKVIALAKEAEAKHPLILEAVNSWEIRNRASNNLLNALF